jgi:hypothetical protein
VPWWIALLIAVTGTAIGYGIDAGFGHKELTTAFAGLYIAGCVIAVLAVRQDGLFTAVIQPPLILFCAVPGAYWLFHGGKLGSLKDLLINCGYPLIERFPLMLGTAGGILLIGLVRWYFGMSHRTAAAGGTTDETAEAADPGAKSFFLSSISAKLNSLLGVGSHEDDADEALAPESRRATANRASQRGATRSNRGTGRSSARSSRTGSPHARPPLDGEHDPRDPGAEHRRRRREEPPRDFDPADPARRSRRRPRPPADSDQRGQAPRENRRDQRGYRDPYERSAPRSSRVDGYEPYESPGPRRFAPYEYEYDPPSEPRRRRPAPNGNNGTNGGDPTHHPISQVRYRGSGPDEQRQERRGRAQGRRPAESWEYDV